MTEAVVLAIYGSILVDLIAFPVPSEASSWQLVTGAEDRPTAAKRLVIYALPAALAVAAFALPIPLALLPSLREGLLPLPFGAVIPGLLLLIAGRLLSLIGAVQLNRSSGGLTESGAFRVSRNPIVVGMWAMHLGSCLVFPSAVLWAGMIPLVANLHRRVRIEEAHLKSQFGPQFDAYAGRVGRYLVF